jgi:hypothetical protein
VTRAAEPGRPRPRIIGLYSNVPSAGKSTVADMLADEYRYKVISFAAPLKETVGAFLREMGMNPFRVIDHLYEPNYKERIIPELGVTSRHLMQTLGTEWGRQCIHPNVWTDAWVRRVADIPTDMCVVADDVRFPNEIEAVRSVGGMIWRIDRPGITIAPEVLNHLSEGGLHDVEPDVVIANDGTDRELLEKVMRTLSAIRQ